MADNRKRYIRTINGVEHTFLLTPEDAERFGDDAKLAESKAPSTKVGTPAAK